MGKKEAKGPGLQETLARLIRPGVTPKKLLKEVADAHPEASKGDIVRAAFAAMIALADKNPDVALILQDVALVERGGPSRRK